MAARPCGFESHPGRVEKCSNPQPSSLNTQPFFSDMVAEERRFKDFVEGKLKKIKSNENFNKKSKDIFLQYVNFKQTERLTYHRLGRVLDLFYQYSKN
ncbi:MAG: hypothetical protein ACO2OO_00720 [Candidatus Aenigmatarchaeota archaeon]